MTHNLEFELIAQPKYTVPCPRCSTLRKKTGTRSLTVYRDTDSYIRWECHHPGCEWNVRQYARDPGPEEVKHDEVGEDILIPRKIDNLPSDINNHPVWWYKDRDGLTLFGVKRYLGTKIFSPVIPTANGFQDKGTKWPKIKTLFNADHLPLHERVIVVEGEKAAEAGQRLFQNSAVVTWRGGANNISSADWDLLKGKDVWLWPDNDAPGKKVMEEIGKLLPVSEYRMIHVDHLPDKADLADNLTADQIKEAYNKAVVSYNRTDSLTMKDLIAQHKRLNVRLVTGWEELDQYVKLPMTGIVTLEARTKNGKSAVAVYLMSKLLEQHKKVVYYSYEIPGSRLVARYLRIYKPELDISQVYMDSIIDEKTEELKNLELYDQSTQYNAEDLLKKLDDANLAGSVVFIDYLQIVPMRGAERQVAIKNLLDKMRVQANQHGYIIFVLSQLTPDHTNPINDAPREARDIHFSSDMVIRLWNKEQEYDHPMYDSVEGNYTIHVTHNRDGEAGAIFGFNFTAGVQFEFLEKAEKSNLSFKRGKTTSDTDKKLGQLIDMLAIKGGIL